MSSKKYYTIKDRKGQELEISQSAAAALSYARRGFRVIPLAPQGKKPLTPQGVHDATKDRKTLLEWFTKNPDANIGIACGGGLDPVVLDVDPRNGGKESLRDLIRKHGALKATYAVKTGGDGWHFYFSYPEPVKSRQLAPGIELIGAGKYVVAPPSVHPSGKEYQWRNELTPKEGVRELAPLPAWMLPAKEKPSPKAGTNGRIPEGTRNVELTRIAGMLRAEGLDGAAIFEALRVVNASQCEPPLEEEEVRRIAYGMERYPAGRAEEEAEEYDMDFIEITHALDLVEGESYALVPLRVRRKGQVETLWHILRRDGVLFGPKGEPKGRLELDVPELQGKIMDRFLTYKAVQAYQTGYRPNPLEVFSRLKQVIDRYIDFNRSIWPQEQGVVFSACWALHTWFLNAFTKCSYLVAKGPRGSGKTTYINLMCQLSHLGYMHARGSTFATVRCLSELGGTQGFDEAADIYHVRHDIQGLFLTGTRCHATVGLMVPKGKRHWACNMVGTFAPRLFAAQREPHADLASRCVVLPLISTKDEVKKNSDPAARWRWPVDWRKLIDDLWLLGLYHLPVMREYYERVEANAEFGGRLYEPWQPLFAVAAWLEDQGAAGMLETMRHLARRYIQHRLEHPNERQLVFQALLEFLRQGETQVTTEQILKAVRELAEEGEGEKLTTRVIAPILRAQEYDQKRKDNRRYWILDPEKVKQDAQAEGIPVD